MNTPEVITLPNGLRIVADHVPSVESVAVGVWVGVGTRYEDMSINGAAHMVEHMLFKGTKKRDALKIAEVIEDVGGHMNAYTGREITSYHVHLLKEDLGLAIDVLADMMQNSTMPQEEIERERGVILQEIGMCHDTPDDIIFDHYYEIAYPGQTLGAPILGSPKHIKEMTRDSLMNYVERFYTPARTVICVSGNFDRDQLIGYVTQSFDSLPADHDHEPLGADYRGGELRENRDLEQSHILMGFQAPSRREDAYYSAQMLSMILGGGMSSRLFQEIREKRGLVYSVFSFHSAHNDDGQFGIYAGTGPEKLPELMPVMCDEILKITQNITAEELNRAKAQLRSGALMRKESMMKRADQNARDILLRGAIRSSDEIIEKINAVDDIAIKNLAKSMFATAPTLCALGPLKELESFDALKQRLAA